MTAAGLGRLGLLGLLVALGCAAPRPAAARVLVLANVHIVNVADGTIAGPLDVEIAGTRIAAIRAAGEAAPPGAKVHEGRGGFLLPGLWDMHAHVNSRQHAAQWALPLFLAAGVTGVRDMDGDCLPPGCAGEIGFVRALQGRIARGELPGPRILAIGSTLVHGPRARAAGAPEWAAPADAAQSRRLVRELERRGVDFVKPYDTLPRAAYFALVQAAREARLPVSGHVPMSVSVLEALRAGQATIEHAKHPAIDCSRYGATFHEVFAEWAAGRSPRIYAPWANLARGDVSLGGYYEPLLAGFDEALCERVIAGMAASGAHYVPTLITRRFEALADREAFLADPRLALVPPELRTAWERDAARYQARFAAAPAERRAYLELYELAVRLVGRAHAAGVPILLGTDAPDSYCFPGSGLLDEMRELRRAGLSNAAILRAATLDAAKFLGLEADHGAIARGKIADLVLLAGNPLQQLEHLARPRAVVFDGRLLDAVALRALEAQAARFAAAARPAAADGPP